MALFLWSTPVLLWSELSHEVMLEKKKSIKIRCNQNMPALPLSDDLWCWSTITFSYNCFRQRIRVSLSVIELILHRLVSNCYDYLLTVTVMQSRRVFLSMNEPILHRLVSNCYDYLLTFAVMQSRWNELIVSCRKFKCLKLYNGKKAGSSFILILTNSRQP